MTRILVVEDEFVTAEGMNVTLGKLGYTVTGLASSGREAIASVERDPPDLVLMDIALNGDIDGIEAAKRIGGRFGIPVIYVTAFANDKTLERALQTTTFGYVVKPFSDDALHSAIEVGLHRCSIDETRARQMRRLELLSNRLAEVRDDERNRIFAGLHEDVAQNLVGLTFQLSALVQTEPSGADAGIGADNRDGELRHARALAEHALAKVHEMSLDLSPPQMDAFGLDSALPWYARRKAREAGWTLHIDAPELGERAPRPVENACFHVLEAALANVQHHANATEVWVHLRHDAEALAIQVRDNGVGFDAEALERKKGHAKLGFLGMEQRVAQAGGRLRIKSAPGAGTEIEGVFPMGGARL